MDRDKGLTMLELLLTLFIVAILTATALPNFSGMIKRRQLNGEVEKLWAALNLARSEAIKRNSKITLCKSNDLMSCSGDWSDGWIIFSDKNGNRIIDGTDSIINYSIGMTGGFKLSWNAFLSGNYLNFDPSGLTNQNGTFKFCPGDNDSAFAKGLIVSKLSRIRVKKDSILCP